MPGADKRIFYDPPGAIGLVDAEPTLHIRFDESETSIRPQDAGLVCDDFDAFIDSITFDMPETVDAVLGRGREFDGTSTGLAARDRESGATLLTRDATIMVVLSWDAAGQDDAGTPGTIVCRGLGGSPSEYVSYGLRVDLFDLGSFAATVRWFWQDLSGADQLQTGAVVTLPPGQFTMLTATRRWVSSTQVELRYYVGDELIGSVTSTDGEIAGGTTGAMQIGHRVSGGVQGDVLAGVIDELMILGREMCAEEIEAHWLRMTVYQPRGVQLFREMIDDGFPISSDPASDVQLDIRTEGMALGFAAARIENLRANFLPHRAYGSTLEQWEQAVAVTPSPEQDIQRRRARVLARMRQRRGISLDGLRDALSEILDCDPEDLVFIAYSNTITDGFDTAVDPVLWDHTPNPTATSVSGQAQFSLAAGSYLLSAMASTWRTIARPVSQPVAQLTNLGREHVIAKLVFTTAPSTGECGVWLGDKGLGNYILLGLKNDGGTFKVVTQAFIGHVAQALTVQATLGGNPAAIWFHLHGTDDDEWTPEWSLTSGSSGFTQGTPVTASSVVHWAGCYVRGEPASALVANFDDFVLWTPNGTRPFNAYVYRDPGLGGQPDLEGAHSVLQAIRHAFTHATVITSLALLSADPESLVARGPMGAP